MFIMLPCLQRALILVLEILVISASDCRLVAAALASDYLGCAFELID